MPRLELELTEDELHVLMYVVPYDSWGDPLKDIYELEQTIGRPIEAPYQVLASVHAKLSSACGKALKK